MKTACKKMRIKLPVGAGSPVRKCVDCGGQMVGTHQAYHYVECGLSSVELLNVLVYGCATCGAHAPEIPAIEVLHTFIAIVVYVHMVGFGANRHFFLWIKDHDVRVRPHGDCPFPRE